MSKTENKTWFVATLQVPAVDADAHASRIQSELGLAPVQIEQAGRPLTWLELYFANEVEALLACRMLERMPGAQYARVRRCDDRDWQSFWRQHFKPQDIGKTLRLLPAWAQSGERSAERFNIVLEPGLSFGTGDHFTTRFCLETLESLLRGGPVERVLDAGTGSGILAIAAALMGCRHIDAFDFDPLCMETAAENMRRNGVEERIDLSRADIREGWKAEPYDIVVANLFSHLLVDVAPALMSLVRGHLVLTGILEHEGDYVADAFMRAGGREIMRDGDGEWCGILIASGRHS